MAFSLFMRLSPEYALNEAYADVKEEGMRGLKKHLTTNALSKIENIETIGNLSTLFTGSNATDLFLSKMGEFEYSVVDMLKGKDSARCVISFSYEDSVKGTIEIKMVKEDKVWKIDNLENPHFEKFALS